MYHWREMLLNIPKDVIINCLNPFLTAVDTVALNWTNPLFNSFKLTLDSHLPLNERTTKQIAKTLLLRLEKGVDSLDNFKQFLGNNRLLIRFLLRVRECSFSLDEKKFLTKYTNENRNSSLFVRSEGVLLHLGSYLSREPFDHFAQSLVNMLSFVTEADEARGLPKYQRDRVYKRHSLEDNSVIKNFAEIWGDAQKESMEDQARLLKKSYKTSAIVVIAISIAAFASLVFMPNIIQN